MLQTSNLAYFFVLSSSMYLAFIKSQVLDLSLLVVHVTQVLLHSSIVNRGEWLGSPANFKGTDKGDNMDVE